MIKTERQALGLTLLELKYCWNCNIAWTLKTTITCQMKSGS